MTAQKCAPGAESASDALVPVINKALGLPSRGTYSGRDPRIVIPETWDGKGETPLGWTRTAAPVWTKDAATTWVPLPDDVAAALLAAPAQAKLTAQERTTLANAIAARVTVDPEAQGAAPKASAAVQAAEKH